jgi:predicted neuraminidase
MKLAAGIVLLLGQTLSVAQSTNGIVKSEFIFASATVPFAECHASTIAESSGHLVAAWFGGSGEGHPDVEIWFTLNESGRWTDPVAVAKGLQGAAESQPCWNPVLFQPTNGPLMLFYKVGPNPRQWWGMLMTSTNGGHTWSLPRRLPDGILGPIKNKPVQLAGGDILCPSSTEDAGWQVHFERTRDVGPTWEKTGPLNDPKVLSAIQPTILFHPDRRLQALGRTKQGKIFQIWSADQGRTWGTMTLTPLPNPNSGIDSLTLQDSRQLLVYNHASSGRSPLNVSVSRDGLEWEPALVLESSGGEFSYPAVIQSADGLVHITYTWKRRNIRHVVLEPARLVLQAR